MSVVTPRQTFEQLVDIRLQEAKVLLDQKHWDGAYYLVGYSVEFALKVRIVSRMIKSDSCPSLKFVQEFHKHELPALLRLAGLEDELKNDPTVGPHWDIVKDWSEQSRYEFGKSESQATNMHEAIEMEVLPWIKARY